MSRACGEDQEMFVGRRLHDDRPPPTFLHGQEHILQLIAFELADHDGCVWARQVVKVAFEPLEDHMGWTWTTGFAFRGPQSTSAMPSTPRPWFAVRIVTAGGRFGLLRLIIPVEVNRETTWLILIGHACLHCCYAW